MSVEAMTVVLHHSRASGAAKVILLGIANHQGDGGAWPAVSTLARYANVDERSVQRALRALEASGELAIDARAGRSNRYMVTVVCPTGCDRTTAHRVIPTPDASVTPQGGGASVTPDASVTPTPDASVTPGVTPVSPEPKENPTLNPDRGSSTASGTDRAREHAAAARAALRAVK